MCQRPKSRTRSRNSKRIEGSSRIRKAPSSSTEALTKKVNVLDEVLEALLREKGGVKP